jgi:hypothetical protein
MSGSHVRAKAATASSQSPTFPTTSPSAWRAEF